MRLRQPLLQHLQPQLLHLIQVLQHRILMHQQKQTVMKVIMLLNRCWEVNCCSFRELYLIINLVELVRLLNGGMDNPELENLTIGSFMRRFGEDVDARSTDGTQNFSSEISC